MPFPTCVWTLAGRWHQPCSSHTPSIPFPTLRIAPVYQSKTTKSWTPELVFRSVSAEIPLQSWEGWTIWIALFHVNSQLPAKECEYTGALDMNPETPEVFVDADEAAKFLFLTRRRILELARTGKLPAHPIGDGARRVRLAFPFERACGSRDYCGKIGVYFSCQSQYGSGPGSPRSCGELRRPHGALSEGMVTSRRTKAMPYVAASLQHG